jgi:hypothetical protein
LVWETAVFRKKKVPNYYDVFQRENIEIPAEAGHLLVSIIVLRVLFY